MSRGGAVAAALSALWARGGKGGHVPLRARRGLFHGRRVIAGNRVSVDYGKKSRRVWLPNVVQARLWSAALGRAVRLPATAAALRAVDAKGGLDRYLASTPDRLLHSDVASELRLEVLMAQRAARERAKVEARRRLGGGAGSAAAAAAAAGASSAAAAAGTAAARAVGELAALRRAEADRIVAGGASGSQERR
jgi:large subunit ribosomal protein L28